MSAWPEAIYTIKKITADILEKYNFTADNFNSLDDSIGSNFTNLNTSMTARFDNIDTTLESLNTNFTNRMNLRQHTIATSTASLASTDFVPGALAFISEN